MFINLVICKRLTLNFYHNMDGAVSLFLCFCNVIDLIDKEKIIQMNSINDVLAITLILYQYICMVYLKTEF